MTSKSTAFSYSSVNFSRYGFLAPPVTEQELESWDAEKQEALDRAAMPEMGALWYISQSQQHQELVKHPVIKVTAIFVLLSWAY